MTSAILTDAPEEPEPRLTCCKSVGSGLLRDRGRPGRGHLGRRPRRGLCAASRCTRCPPRTPTGKHLAELRDARRHPHLPDLRLSPEILVTSNETDVLAGARIVVVAVASRYVREALKRTSPYVAPDALVVIASKGMEAATGKTLSEVVADVLPGRRIVVASGGSHAEEVVNNLPFGLDFGGRKRRLRAR